MVASAGCLSMPLLRHHLAPFSAKLFAINSSRIPPQPKPPSGAKSGLGPQEPLSKAPVFFPGSRSLGSELWVIGFEFGTIACRFGLVIRHFECNRHPQSVMGIDVNSLAGLSSKHNGVFTE